MKLKIVSAEQYISAAPKEAQAKLRQMRRLIGEAAPKALEKISYGMPYYDYHGRLAYFAVSKNHIGLYIPPPVIAEHKKELAKYATAVATVRFPLSKELPATLIKKLVRARVKINEVKIKQ